MWYVSESLRVKVLSQSLYVQGMECPACWVLIWTIIVSCAVKFWLQISQVATSFFFPFLIVLNFSNSSSARAFSSSGISEGLRRFALPLAFFVVLKKEIEL